MRETLPFFPESATAAISLHSQKVWSWFSGGPLHILAILVIALLAQRWGSRAISKTLNRIASAEGMRGTRYLQARQKERAKTTGTLLSSALTAVIGIIAIGMIFSEFGLDLGPFVASAGIIGIALGLGAQTLVRDILSGIFMLIEDQYGVGDQITVLEISGTVEKVGLRITAVRDLAGTLWYLRNGEILKVGNSSQSG